MDKDFMQYVYARCERALQEDMEYKELERESSDQDAIQAKAEALCYIRGYKDALSMLK